MCFKPRNGGGFIVALIVVSKARADCIRESKLKAVASRWQRHRGCRETVNHGRPECPCLPSPSWIACRPARESAGVLASAWNMSNRLEPLESSDCVRAGFASSRFTRRETSRLCASCVFAGYEPMWLCRRSPACRQLCVLGPSTFRCPGRFSTVHLRKIVAKGSMGGKKQLWLDCDPGVASNSSQSPDLPSHDHLAESRVAANLRAPKGRLFLHAQVGSFVG